MVYLWIDLSDEFWAHLLSSVLHLNGKAEDVTLNTVPGRHRCHQNLRLPNSPYPKSIHDKIYQINLSDWVSRAYVQSNFQDTNVWSWVLRDEGSRSWLVHRSCRMITSPVSGGGPSQLLLSRIFPSEGSFWFIARSKVPFHHCSWNSRNPFIV